MSAYLINSVAGVNTSSGPMAFKAGALIMDSTLIAAIQAAGGVFASSTDPFIIAAAGIVVKLRQRGQNEELLTNVMTAAAAQSAGALTLVNTTPSIAASATITFAPDVIDRAGTVIAAFLEVVGTPAAGESASLQFRKNTVNTGSALVYDSTKTGKTQYSIPALVGLVVAPGDLLDYVDTYVPGGGPALVGELAVHTVKVTISSP